MKPPICQPLSVRQHGAASIAIVMLIMFILMAAVTGALRLSDSSLSDATVNEEQVAAFFLAESGLERAQAIISDVASIDSYNYSICTGLTTNPTVNLGRGSFTFTSTVSYPSNCVYPNCTKCVVTVRGDIGSSSRILKAEMAATKTYGVSGQTNSGDQTRNLTPSFTLNLKARFDNSYVFNHLIYNPTTNWGGDAVTGTCENNGPGSLTVCTESWKIAGTYYNNPASQGVFAHVTNAGIYSITESLTAPTSSDTRRNYALAGVIFRPLPNIGGTVNHVGSYSQSPSGCPAVTLPRTQPVTANCSPYDYQHGYIPATNVSTNYWTCNPSSGTTPDWSNAAAADTLFVGIGGKPYRQGGTVHIGQLNGLSLNGQPIHRHLSMNGAQGDLMYSQIWYTYNPGYDSVVTNATNLAVAATFTGTIGATITGHTTNGATRFVLDSALGSDEMLSVGDSIMSTSGATNYGTIVSLRSGTWGQSGSVYNISGGSTISPVGTSLRSYSTVLRLTSAPSSGAMALNDSITNAAGTTTYGNLGSLLSGTLNAAGSTYRLTGGSSLQVSGSANNMRAYRGSATITLSGATNMPAVGTALAVVSGNGQFFPDSVIGSISGTTLTITSVPASPTQVNGTNLSVGDALYGANIAVNTVITARLSGAGGTGTYSISPSQTVASGAVMARAAVVAVTSANSFTVSRLPDSTISGARLCGGLCPLLLADGTTGTGAHAAGQFDLSGIQDYDDWSGGFSCLSGVDTSTIETIGTTLSKRSFWNELVQ